MPTPRWSKIGEKFSGGRRHRVWLSAAPPSEMRVAMDTSWIRELRRSAHVRAATGIRVRCRGWPDRSRMRRRRVRGVGQLSRGEGQLWCGTARLGARQLLRAVRTGCSVSWRRLLGPAQPVRRGHSSCARHDGPGRHCCIAGARDGRSMGGRTRLSRHVRNMPPVRAIRARHARSCRTIGRRAIADRRPPSVWRARANVFSLPSRDGPSLCAGRR